jgi:glucose-1-phosphate adenylyltransferase
VTIRNSIVMGNDYYDSEERAAERQSPLLEIGEGTVIEGAIIDKNVSIGKNVRVINQSQRDQTNLDHDTCVIRDGIPILIKKAVLPDDWNLEEHLS